MLNLHAFSIKNERFPSIIDRRRIFIPTQPSTFTVVLVVKGEVPLALELVISAKLVRGRLLLDRWLKLYGLGGLNNRGTRFCGRFSGFANGLSELPKDEVEHAQPQRRRPRKSLLPILVQGIIIAGVGKMVCP